jgi:putative transposase
VEPGLAHHITQRGNNRQDVFVSAGDRQHYVQILAEHLDRHRVRVLAWCLMTNHVHLVAVPEAEESLGLALGQAHSQYALEWNRETGRVGHLWQNRFFSCSLEAGRLLAVIRYVERNPVRAHMVEHAWDWPWSSAIAHVNRGAGDPLLDLEWKEWIEGAGLGAWDSEGWQAMLARNQSGEEVGAIRRATHAGEPFGALDFVERLEAEAGRRLRVLKRGRPATEKATAGGGQGGLFE